MLETLTLRVYGQLNVELLADLLSESNVVVHVEGESGDDLGATVSGWQGEIEMSESLLRAEGYDVELLNAN